MMNLLSLWVEDWFALGCKSQGYKYSNHYLLWGGLCHETIHTSKRKLSLSLSLYFISLLNTDLIVGGASLGKNTRGRPSCRTKRGHVIITRSAVPQLNVSPSFRPISSTFFLEQFGAVCGEARQNGWHKI